MTASEMTLRVLEEKNLNNHDLDLDLVLHEVVLGGALQRPIHYSEQVLGKYRITPGQYTRSTSAIY